MKVYRIDRRTKEEATTTCGNQGRGRIGSGEDNE